MGGTGDGVVGSGSPLELAPVGLPHPPWGWLWVSLLSTLPGQVGLGGGGEHGWVGGDRQALGPLAHALLAVCMAAGPLWKDMRTSSGSPMSLPSKGQKKGQNQPPAPDERGQKATISEAAGKAGQDVDSQTARARQTDRDRRGRGHHLGNAEQRQGLHGREQLGSKALCSSYHPQTCRPLTPHTPPHPHPRL